MNCHSFFFRLTAAGGGGGGGLLGPSEKMIIRIIFFLLFSYSTIRSQPLRRFSIPTSGGVLCRSVFIHGHPLSDKSRIGAATKYCFTWLIRVQY